MSLILIGTDNHLPEHELDSLTRKRFRINEGTTDQSKQSITWLIIITAFISGMIFGSSIHDWLFHGADKLLK
jgi:hypothetical protein